MSASREKDINAPRLLLLLDEAEKAFREKDFAEAEKRYQSFLDGVGDSEKFQAERAICLQRIGDLSLETGRLDRAEESYQNLLTLALQHLSNDHHGVVAIQQRLAMVKAAQSVEAQKPVEFSHTEESFQLFGPEPKPLNRASAVKPVASTSSRFKSHPARKGTWLRVACGAALLLLCLVAINSASCLTAAGNVLRQSGRNETAIAIYDIAYRLQPDSAVIPFNRGCAKAALNQFPDAIGDFKSAIERAPNYADAYYSCGMAQFATHDYKDAIKSFDGYISLEPGRPEGYVRRGLSNAKLGRYSAAIKDDERAIRFDPANMEAVNNRNWALDLQCDEDMEKQTGPSQRTSHAEQQGGENTEIPSKPASATEQTRKIVSLDQILADAPTADAYCQRGSLFLNQGKTDEAMSDFNKAIRLDPKSVVSYVNRGLAYYKLGRFDKAVDDYSKAIFYDAENASAYYRRGLAFDQLRKYSLAASDYDNAARLNPARAAVYTALANTDRRLLAKADSGNATTIAAKIGTQKTESVRTPVSPPTSNRPRQTATPQAQQNRLPNASSWNSLPAQQPSTILDGEALYKQAKEDQGAQRWEVAISEFIQLLKTNSAPSKTSWCYHNLGQCYLMVGRVQDSMTCYNRGLQVNPREVTTLVSRGQLYWHQYHDYQRAYADATKALSIRPTWAEAIALKNELDNARTGAAGAAR